MEVRITKLVETAFRGSAIKYPEIHKAWIDMSINVGNQLPDSLLTVSIQRSGDLDMLLRAMEDEKMANIVPKQEAGIDLSFTYLMMLSELWIGQVYEFIRLITEKHLEPVPDQFKEVSHFLRMLRIPLEKYEIAADRKLSSPLEMRKTPALGDDSDFFVYSKEDPNRSHIMPSGVSERGSIMWQVTDIPNEKSYWLERRNLSEKILEAAKKKAE